MPGYPNIWGTRVETPQPGSDVVSEAMETAGHLFGEQNVSLAIAF
jgi:hypothetical protein